MWLTLCRDQPIRVVGCAEESYLAVSDWLLRAPWVTPECQFRTQECATWATEKLKELQDSRAAAADSRRRGKPVVGRCKLVARVVESCFLLKAVLLKGCWFKAGWLKAGWLKAVG